MRVVLQEHAPQVAKLVACGAAGERIERLALLEENALAGDVLLLDPYARRVHAAEDRSVPAARDLAAHPVPKRRHGGGEVLEARDLRVDVPEYLPHLAHRLGQARVGLSVVVADHEEKHVPVRVGAQAIDDLRGLLPYPAAQHHGILARRTDQGQRIGVVVDKVRRAHAVARGRLPPKLASDGLTLVAHAAREDVGVVPERAEELRKLRRVAEGVGDIRDTRCTPKLAGAAEPLLEVADDRLAGNEE